MMIMIGNPLCSKFSLFDLLQSAHFLTPLEHRPDYFLIPVQHMLDWSLVIMYKPWSSKDRLVLFVQSQSNDQDAYVILCAVEYCLKKAYPRVHWDPNQFKRVSVTPFGQSGIHVLASANHFVATVLNDKSKSCIATFRAKPKFDVLVTEEQFKKFVVQLADRLSSPKYATWGFKYSILV